MASQYPTHRNPLYPEIIHSDPPNRNPNPSPSSSNLYPSIDMSDLVDNLFPDTPPESCPSAPPEGAEEEIVRIPGAILHLIDRHYSVELASGEFSVVKLRQGHNVVAVLARVGDEIQWPLAKDETAVKLDASHYFFSLRSPDDGDGDEILNYGLTIASEGKEKLIRDLDSVLESHSLFSVQKVSREVDGTVAPAATCPAEMKVAEGKSAAYWTTLAPNVEDYSGTAAKMIAAGSGHVVRGILWCGDVTVDRLKWGNEVMKKRMTPGADKEVSPQTLRRIKRVKRVSKMTEKVANGVLSGVIKVSGFFTSSVANSKVGKKFFSLLPGEIVLASLDGFSKVCDAVEVSGKNVMSTSSNVTTELVTHKYGDQAGKATNEGLDAAGHAIGAAWAAFKIRKAFNPKSVLKPIAKNAAKAAAVEQKAKKKSK